MRITHLIFFFLFTNLIVARNHVSQINIDTVVVLDSTASNKIVVIEENNIVLNIYDERLRLLDARSPMDLSYNEKVQPFIDSYLGVNKSLISKMQGLEPIYFPLFERELDKYNLPLELKYLAIVESALNPRAKSKSGASGLWQFMYLTGKEFELNVTSYIDERQDPYKSTQAACKYFLELYEMFGDWNLVLAAYNGGPGYLQRTINNVGSYNFWDLHPYLREETRNYVPTFIAINYIMNYAKEHQILSKDPALYIGTTDSLTIKEQLTIPMLEEMLCVEKNHICFLNPSYKQDVIPSQSTLILPKYAVEDFLNNEESNYIFIKAVENKEILINEERIVYTVKKGDYLGKIAQAHGVKVFELKVWNNLNTSNLDIDDKLVIYIKQHEEDIKNTDMPKAEYVVKKGDTLWDIAQKLEGVTVESIKLLNNLENNNLEPGKIILLPKS